jgi:hypothetical protein
MRTLLKVLAFCVNCAIAFLIGLQFTTLDIRALVVAGLLTWVTLWEIDLIDGHTP